MIMFVNYYELLGEKLNGLVMLSSFTKLKLC